MVSRPASFVYLSVVGNVFLGLLFLGILGSPRTASAGASFIRGDSDASGVVDVTDAVHLLTYKFLGGAAPTCMDAADSNDTGEVDVSDAVYTLIFLFIGGLQMPAPGLACGADPTDNDNLSCLSFAPCPQVQPEAQKVNHLINRIAYGPDPETLNRVNAIGIDDTIEEQLNPSGIDESQNTELNSRLVALQVQRLPSKDTKLVPGAAAWRYFKGSQAPPADWKTAGFDGSSWIFGVAPIGYGYNDNATVLADMPKNANQPGYLSVFLRKEFTFSTAPANLILRVDYDDGFVAYLNGTEVKRVGLAGNPPAYNVAATGHNSSGFEDFDISSKKNLLAAGKNVLALQVHNNRIDGGDLKINVELVSREILPGDPIVEYGNIDKVKAMAHVRGIYSKRQLQTVLADFWENHLTTDYDKLVEYLDNLTNSDATDAMSAAQAQREAATLEAKEYEYLLEHALGNFGDLLRYSAKSPTMLVYLDNILNVKGVANENYAREILELHSFGVDNGYTQQDIENAARAFTGWGICKVSPENYGDPHAPCGPDFNDIIFLNQGAGWKYLKGTAEPTPDGNGNPTTAWTAVDFDDNAWAAASDQMGYEKGIGYGDNDDATDLSKLVPPMQNNYLSVYLRRSFNVTDPYAFKNLILDVKYDDGYVAYLNGIEVGRTPNLKNYGNPPAYNRQTAEGHEVTEDPLLVNLNKFLDILKVGKNVLAIQVHNSSPASSDLSLRPRLVDREILPGSIENGDPNGVWSFHFFPDRHDYTAKSIFPGKPYFLSIPAKTLNDPVKGLADANDMINKILEALPTAQFICTKLIQKFVSDEVPPALLADCIATWNSTVPKGNIEEVMRTILTSEEFWSEAAYRAKVKTPLEFVNSSVRALNAQTDGLALKQPMLDMGMEIFTRDEPDGWPELGVEWIDTSGFLNRIKFVQDLLAKDSTLQGAPLGSNVVSIFDANDAKTADAIVTFMNDLLYAGTLRPDETAILLQFLTTDDNYSSLPLVWTNPPTTSYKSRVETGVSLMLSLPQWNFQ
ncbi:MAG: DUF1800 family protein [Planctomycetes bacterium]|nr:DUF1800 family protein [Planctomycetota bacterium]